VKFDSSGIDAPGWLRIALDEGARASLVLIRAFRGMLLDLRVVGRLGLCRRWLVWSCRVIYPFRRIRTFCRVWRHFLGTKPDTDRKTGQKHREFDNQDVISVPATLGENRASAWPKEAHVAQISAPSKLLEIAPPLGRAIMHNLNFSNTL
jgi:hypothetical protein